MQLLRFNRAFHPFDGQHRLDAGPYSQDGSPRSINELGLAERHSRSPMEGGRFWWWHHFGNSADSTAMFQAVPRSRVLLSLPFRTPQHPTPLSQDAISGTISTPRQTIKKRYGHDAARKSLFVLQRLSPAQRSSPRAEMHQRPVRCRSQRTRSQPSGRPPPPIRFQVQDAARLSGLAAGRPTASFRMACCSTRVCSRRYIHTSPPLSSTFPVVAASLLSSYGFMTNSEALAEYNEPRRCRRLSRMSTKDRSADFLP